MEIICASCKVRSWKRRDRDSLVHHANNRNVWINLRNRFPYPYTTADAENFFAIVVGREPETSFAIEVNGKAVGGVGFSLLEDEEYRSAEIGYWLGEEFWGRGIATEVLIAVTEYAFSRFDLCRLYAHVFEWDVSSARVLEKAGYALEGRMRKSVTKDGKTSDR